MKASSLIFLGFVVGTLGGVRATGAEGAPDIIWEAPTPSGLANSIQGVGWSPFNFSADGRLQSAATQGAITIRQRSDGAVVRGFPGGASQGSTPLVFSPDGTRVAAWNPTSGKTTLWRISDGTVLMEFRGGADEGVGAIRFAPAGAHLATTGYLPFVDSAGLWQQRGIIRFWRVADGALIRLFDTRTGVGVTSPVAWSPDATRFAFGTYEGAAVVARVPAEAQGSIVRQRWQGENSSLEISGNGDVRFTQLGVPGTDYHVEVTTNSVAWREAGVTRANGDGVFQFLDTNGHGCALRLYRAWRAP